ncbi:MAG: hypothetical protein ABEL51_03575, partial [Salinibacter sp.]
MSNELFLITGGGTGAKVAESLVHLCAAGIGPDRAHILLIDSDTANGNLRRTKETIRNYQQLQEWPWSVRSRSEEGGFGKETREVIDLFKTDIRKYEITEEIDTVHQGGLETSVQSEGMQNVMDLLFDEDEQRATCEDGFRARPNLGCLLMSDHLNDQLRKSAGGFLEDMERAISRHNRVPVVVTASVFGGTGASLLPVIRGCVENALSNDEYADRLVWSAVQLLPHYQPREKKESVDPDRFFLDTSSALQYYSMTHDGNGSSEADGLFEAMYMVGSDDPGRNTVKTVLGSGEQANPPYFEEVIAAFFALDAAGREEDGADPVRVYVPNQLEWGTLPYRHETALQKRMALLLHLAAFYLHPSPRGDNSQLENGLGAMVRDVAAEDLRMYGWYNSLLDDWAQNGQSGYSNTDGDRKVETLRAGMGRQSINEVDEKVAEFMGRHLLWAETAMKGKGLSFVDYEKGSYARLYDAMSEVTAEEIEVSDQGSGGRLEFDADNALIRLLRASIAALTYDDRR